MGEYEENWNQVIDQSEELQMVVIAVNCGYTEFAELIPKRPSGIALCAGCQGTGRFPDQEGIVCPDCYGAGWPGASMLLAKPK